MGTKLMTSILYFVLHPYLLCMGAPGGPISTAGVPISITPIEFYEAARDGEVSIIEDELLTGSNNDQLLNWRNDGYHGFFALHIATENNHGQIVRLLLWAGADPNMNDNDSGSTPVFIAAKYGHTTVLGILLESRFKADVDLQDDKIGATPVYIAAKKGNAAALELLVAHGADVNKVTSDGSFPLGEASVRGYAAVVRILINAGADIGYATPRYRLTALHKAAWFNHKDVARILLQNGGDKSKQDNDGFTPADSARNNGNNELASFIDNY